MWKERKTDANDNFSSFHIFKNEIEIHLQKKVFKFALGQEVTHSCHSWSDISGGIPRKLKCCFSLYTQHKIYIYESRTPSNYNVQQSKSFHDETLRGRNFLTEALTPTPRVDNEIYPRDHRRPRPDRDIVVPLLFRNCKARDAFPIKENRRAARTPIFLIYK